MSFFTRSSSLDGIKMGDVFPGKGPFFEPFTFPDCTHF